MPFAVLVDADDDELPGLRRMCDARCEDLHQPDALGEESFFKYRVPQYIFSGRCHRAGAAFCRYSSMMAVTLSRRIGRSGSLVTIITKSVSTPKSCSPGSTDTLAVKELPAGMRCPGTSVVAILPLVSTARTTSSALPYSRA